MTVVKLLKFQSNVNPCSGLPDISETTSCWPSGIAKKTSSQRSPGPRNSHGSRLRRRLRESRSIGLGARHLRHRLLHLALIAGGERRVRVQLLLDRRRREDQLVLGQFGVGLGEDLLNAL